jgi:hypothetical protein
MLVVARTIKRASEPASFRSASYQVMLPNLLFVYPAQELLANSHRTRYAVAHPRFWVPPPCCNASKTRTEA